MNMTAVSRLLRHGLLAALVAGGAAHADGGISVSGTRIIFPAGDGQTTVTLHNSSTSDSYLIQSWVDGASGGRTPDMVVTPPLFVSHPGNENTLRIMYTGGALPQDRETLYYFIEKAIPSVDRASVAGKNVVTMAAAQRIKLFVRPSGLPPDAGEAPSMLTFHRAGNRLEVSNPSPYYITLTGMKAGSQPLQDGMVAPHGTLSQALPAGAGGTVTFHTINDYGAVTPARSAAVQ